MIKSWSPSRYAKWAACARRAKYEIVDKLCPACFKGALTGKFKEPQTCDKCGAEQSVPPAVQRGTDLHTAVETAIRHPKTKLGPGLKNVTKLVKMLRKDYAAGNTTIEESIVLNDKWEPISVYTKDAWLRTALDVLTVDVDAETAEVIDWKSGNIDKRTGEISHKPEYADQLQVYAVAVLSAYPKVKSVAAVLAFFDAPEGRNEVVVGGCVSRRDLAKLQAKWSAKAQTMMQDTVFAPNPTISCRWCSFSKAKGGPCAF